MTKESKLIYRQRPDQIPRAAEAPKSQAEATPDLEQLRAEAIQCSEDVQTLLEEVNLQIQTPEVQKAIRVFTEENRSFLRGMYTSPEALTQHIKTCRMILVTTIAEIRTPQQALDTLVMDLQNAADHIKNLPNQTPFTQRLINLLAEINSNLSTLKQNFNPSRTDQIDQLAALQRKYGNMRTQDLSKDFFPKH